jgi:thymidylate synthase
MSKYDQLYRDLVDEILWRGTNRDDRTGIGSRTLFGQSFTVDLHDGFPILTTRKVAFRIAFEETMFFLRGETDTKKLEDKRINIWKGNTSREFLDKMGLQDLPEGSLGTGYSHQWRNFGGTLGQHDGVDQIADTLARARTNPNDRRLLISAWNPQQLGGTPLAPCHVMQQYQIVEGKLNSLWFQRSVDTIYGLPYNVMSYAFLNLAFSKHLGLQPGTLTFFGGDTHIYQNQIVIATAQVQRSWWKYEAPTLKINKDLATFDDILALEYSDVELVGYESYPDFEDKPPMAV